MSYVALYRKFRPQTFDQLKGQEHVVRALKNQLKADRIGHAYLFTGTRGTGKTSAAKLFAKAVNCLHLKEGEPCNECENCRAINAGSFVDVAEVDAASNNGVDDIRRIIEEVRYTPVRGRYKVYIIDEAHMITGQAFNAFLKTLEEPPAYAVFIMATTEPHKLPITILSRCQRYDFKRISQDEIAGNLNYIADREGISADGKALRYIARAGDGSMRDSISLLDKCIAFNLGETLTYETVLDTLGTVDTEVFSGLFRFVYSGDAAGALQVIDRAAGEGRDLTQFATDLIWYVRNILMTKAAGIRDPEILGISSENMEQLVRDAQIAEEPVLMRYIRILSELLGQIRYASEKQVLLEVGIIKLAKPEMETDTASLADRIRHLEQELRSGQFQPARPAKAPGGNGGIPWNDLQEPYFPQEDPAFQNIPQEPFWANAPEPPAYQSIPAEPIRQTAPAGPGNQSIPAEPARQTAPAGSGYQSVPTAPAAPADASGLWEQIVRSCSNPRIRIALGKCSADFPEDSVVRVYAPNIVVLKQIKEDTELEILRRTASETMGKDMTVQVVLAGPDTAPSDMGNAFPEDLLGNININIGTEEW
ncbi:MAG: DNA polymerase III subunit gamma/tau [Parasporobacterium sp.]|nr:DNA polymerase III subunit gamma/tau [Parasporobacterium sp.]